MHHTIKTACISLSLMFLITSNSDAQSNLEVSVPFIYSWVKVANNWSPPTAVHRKDAYQGASLGYGATILYSFYPDLLGRHSNINVNVGIGYFKQRFNLQRPFDYNSPVEPVFYTDHYAYDCWQAILGLSYNYPVGAHYSLSGDLSYQWMRSFRQRYTPRANPAETSHRQIDFAGMLVLAIGLNRDLGQRFLLSAQLLAPVHTRWRNDKIFKDDPTAFSKPRFSVGSAIGLAYYLREKNSLQ